MKHIMFYALKDDILPVLENVEKKHPLKYVRTGNFQGSAEILVFNEAAEIPNLGKATFESAVLCDTYLVCRRESTVRPARFRADDGANRFSMDQRLNLETITFTAGGVLNDEIVLYGRFATCSDSPASQELMKLFNSSIRKTFTKIKAYHVGPQAVELLDRGARLTLAAQTPRDFDLKR